MRFGFFLREAMRAMRRNAAPTFAALATVLVTMLVLGVFIPIVQATDGAANSVRSRVLVDVYMKTTATAGRRRARAQGAARAPARQVGASSSPSSRPTQQQAKQDPQAYALLRLEPAARHLPRDPGQPGERAARPQRAAA